MFGFYSPYLEWKQTQIPRTLNWFLYKVILKCEIWAMNMFLLGEHSPLAFFFFYLRMKFKVPLFFSGPCPSRSFPLLWWPEFDSLVVAFVYLAQALLVLIPIWLQNNTQLFWLRIPNGRVSVGLCIRSSTRDWTQNLLPIRLGLYHWAMSFQWSKSCRIWLLVSPPATLSSVHLV